MSTTREFHPSAASPSSHSGASLWARVCTAIEAAWKRAPVKSQTPAGTTAEVRVPCLPVAGKVAAISMAEKPARTVHGTLPRTLVPSANSKPAAVSVARRPGVQSRWKASDRVAML